MKTATRSKPQELKPQDTLHKPCRAKCYVDKRRKLLECSGTILLKD